MHRSLAIWVGNKGGLKAHRKPRVDKQRRREEEGGRTRKEGDGRREEFGERRGREKEEGGNIPDSTKRVLTFSAVRF